MWVAFIATSLCFTTPQASELSEIDEVISLLESLSANPEAATAALERLRTLETPTNHEDAVRTGRELLESLTDSSRTDAQDESSFWSFRPLVRFAPPVVKREAWVRNDIDRFTLGAMEERSLIPAERASKQTLVRRLYFDLTGLPPTPEEVDAFLANDSDDAYEKLVDRLLASPRYGERWGRHWLDVARYADSAGYEFDYERPYAYPYRDFVIQAFNSDMPYDQFVRWQLAGDEYEPDNPSAIAATGFCTSGPNVNNQVTDLNRYNELDDILSTTVLSFLGLTMQCARCHDHKYDPIPANDYYRMLTAFTTSERKEVLMVNREERDAFREKKKEWDREKGKAQRELRDFLRPFKEEVRLTKIDELDIEETDKELIRAKRDGKNNDQVVLLATFKNELNVSDKAVREVLGLDEHLIWGVLDEDIKEVEALQPESPPKVLAMTDKKTTPADSFFLTRGNPDTKGDKVSLGFLGALPGADDTKFSPENFRRDDGESTFQRTALAEWITDVEDGAGRLTARVIMNRVWLNHFGRGIVGTPNDFGTQGDRPTHPELLDWLATELLVRDWSLKEMHKLILMSATYQMSTTFNDANNSIDPSNRFWWRREPLRLQAEAIRDAILASSGTLNKKMFGPGVRPFMHPDAIATGSTNKWPLDVKDGPKTWRRSVYIHIRRSVLMPMMEAFDAPDTTASCAKRNTTTVPSQALAMMNSPFLHDQAQRFASRVKVDVKDDRPAQVNRVFKLALARAPSDAERDASLRYLEQAEASRASADEAFTDFCQLMLNLNEFVYVN